MNEVFQNFLWLGNVFDAIAKGNEFDVIISVLEMDEPDFDRQAYFAHKHPVYINAPILVYDYQESGLSDSWADPQKLDFIADALESYMRKNYKVLIHCAMGMERSPLAVVWWLHKYRKMSLDEAYHMVKMKHNITADRRTWLKKAIPAPLYKDS